ncbi:hypothetical protein Peternella1_54 [Winogradskyella phage Peternella_1]|uniref:Uncharacterized protein n=1 Tax=Winogradskyella phage Peternella_1 TaxID=2745699 RepID=A0A8E4ZG39_9CAUD|nr:hypothetical protein M1M32_gp54 [Winogradskyella phage Peternella_1]QQV91590.1 hypothetical protein Peternella1_54 [Winogradskyella phage Peternella_1]
MITKIIAAQKKKSAYLINQFQMPEIIRRTGLYSECSPTSVFKNNKTFTTGITPWEVNNNKVYAAEIAGRNIVINSVNEGTTSTDVFDHPRPIILLDDDDFIWILQVNPHHSPIAVYKSSSPNTISDGFNYRGLINTNAAYLLLYEQNNKNVKILTRGADINLYGHKSISVDLETLLFTAHDVTNTLFPSTHVRHYMSLTQKYGVRTREWFTINHRYEPTEQIYKCSAYYFEKSNPLIIFNLDGSYSKDITSSPITELELEDNNFAIQGNNLEKTKERYYGRGCQVNDDYYVNHRNSDGSWNILRIDSSNNFTYSQNFTLKEDGDNVLYILFNGHNLVVQFVKENTVFIYALSLDLQTLYLKDSIEVPQDSPLDLPANLDMVNDQYAMVIRDDSSINFNWINTNNKFLI